MQHRIGLKKGRTVALVAAMLAVLATTSPSAQEEFPFTRERGHAAVEYQNKDIHIVAAYYYSQRNHDSRWLLIEAAVASAKPMTISRESIALRTPEGREIPLATQRRFAEDIERVRPLVQNASASRHNVASYFNQRNWTDRMRLFALPFQGIVHNEFIVDENSVARGDLFFEAPTGRWEDGTYSLIIRHAQGQAELPIELE